MVMVDDSLEVVYCQWELALSWGRMHFEATLHHLLDKLRLAHHSDVEKKGSSCWQIPDR